MAVSDFFTDEELEAQLRLFFEEEEQFDTDFTVFFNQIIDRGADLYLEFRGKRFSIDKITGFITEVE